MSVPRVPRDVAAETLAKAERLMRGYARAVARIPAWMSDDQRRRLIAEAATKFRVGLEALITTARFTLGGDGRYDFRWERRLGAVMQDVNRQMLELLTTPGVPKRAVAERATHLLGYRVRRIAVSELNNAVVERTLAAFRADPTVLGVRWVTTSADPCPTCVELAHANDYGLGAGVYPLARVPDPPHPYCRCARVAVRFSARGQAA